jgi:CheY-like chemotaxis protein
MCLLRSDGSSFYAQLRATPAHNGEYWITLADNSVQKKLEIELSRTRTAAEAANRAKSVFLATMSHEIRSPINGIIGLTDILLESELTEKQLGYTKTIKQAGKCLVQLVGNILDLSKIEANKVELEVINFNLQVEMNGMINLLALQAHKKWLELNLQIDDVPLRLRGDAGRLCQIITNLISNAIKFTEAGSVALQVSKEQEDRRQVTLRFVVRDSGIGIEACRLGTIFDPFTQADDSITRKFGGTGLGLTIARQLTELMGGSMGVESVPGKGSTFWLTAVFEKQTSSSESIDTGYAQDRHRPEISANSAHNGLRILLAEDDHINQLVSASILTKLGYKVDVVPNGTDALRKLSTEDYDLVLMDCMMPGVNGYEATAVIRDKESAVRNHAIPVIALSGNVFVTDQEKCRAAGMDDFLSKPVIILDLVALLEKWSAADRTLHQNTG